MQTKKRLWILIGCLALLVVLGLTGSFFYQNYVAEQREIAISTTELLPVKEGWKEEQGSLLYTREYLLKPEETPEALNRESFEEDGIRWEFFEMRKEPRTTHQEKAYEHKVTFESGTGNMKTLLGMLDSTKDITTEDGYQGTVYLDASTIRAEAAGYQNKTVTVQKTREYPYLDSQDLSSVPKSITEGGVTYRFKTVNWQVANTGEVDGYRIPDRYTAIATYESSLTRKAVSGYRVTASYYGVVAKETVEGIQYVMLFSGTPVPFWEQSAVRVLTVILFLAAAAAAAVILIRRVQQKREAEKPMEERW